MANQSLLRTHSHELRGKGGRRKGYASRNEIEDMRLFDQDPGKNPSLENGEPPPEPPEHAENAGTIAPIGRGKTAKH